MTQPPDYRRRRIAVAMAAAALLVVAQRETPTLGTVSISLDETRAPRVDARLAPPLDAVAAVLAQVIVTLAR